MRCVGRVLEDHRMKECVGLEGSLKITEQWNGWVGRVLKDRRMKECIVLEGSLKITE